MRDIYQQRMNSGVGKNVFVLILLLTQACNGFKTASVESMAKSQPRSTNALIDSSTLIPSLTLINANTNSEQAIDGVSGHTAIIADGSTLYLGSVGQALNIRADIASAGSVLFGFDGQDQYHIENVSPYAFASDDNGVYHSWTPAVGDHVVSVTPYSDSSASGVVGKTLRIHFKVDAGLLPSPLTLSSFSLINTQSNQAQALDGVADHSAVIADQSIIDLTTVGKSLNIRADIASPGSVIFDYDNGAISHIENTTPYALASDNGGIYNSWTPTLGQHTLKATAYSGSNAGGTAGPTLIVHFAVIDSSVVVATPTPAPVASGPLSISSFTLINANSSSPQAVDGIAGHSAVIVDNSSFNLLKVGQALNIRADIAAPGSVIFDYDNGAISHIENVAPYAFASDNSGVYNSWTPAVGAHVLKATAYSGSNATGTAGAAFVVHFNVQSEVASTPTPTPVATPAPVVASGPLSIPTLTLINASSNNPQPTDGIAGHSAVIADNAILDFAKVGQALNIRADIAAPGSVIFDYDNGAISHIENVAPYAFASDNGGIYNSWTPLAGGHVLKATAYSGSNASGTAGATLVIHFTVQSSGSVSTPTPAPVQTVGSPLSTAEPSSYSSHLIITHGGTYTGNYLVPDMGWDSYAIKIATTEPVIIENCHLAGPGILINARYANANLTVRNCSFHGYAPIVDNQPRGRAIDMTTFRNVDVENNFFENTGTPLAAIDYKGNGTTDTIKMLRNRVRNINGKYRNSDVDEHNMFQNFVSVQGNTAGNPPNAEIGWNEVINEPGKSASEDLINFHRSGGQSGSWFKVHDNFLRGSYHPNPYDGNGSGGGVQIDGEDNSTAANIEIYGNTIMQIMNGGMGAAAGSHVYMHHNRVISSGQDALGQWWAGSWAGVWIFKFYNSDPNPMTDIRIEQNVLGWQHQGSTSQISSCTNRNDYNANLLGGISNNTEFKCGPITEADQDNEYQLYLQKVQASGVKVGPQQ